MKITNIEYFALKCPLPDNYMKPTASFVRDGSIYLRVFTDTGIEGIGEPSPYGAKLNEMVSILKNVLIPKWIGKDPLDINSLILQEDVGIGYGNISQNALIAGFSQALWDIYGKYKKIPVYKLINPNSDGKIQAYASAGMWYESTPIEEVVKEALIFFNNGFNFYKLRPETPEGSGNHMQRNLNPPKVNLKRFINLLEKINISTNGKLKIIVDAGCRLNFNEALYLCKAMEELNCVILEEPIPRNYEEYIKLKRSSKMALAGGESLVSESQFMPWVKGKALDYLQPDANLAGINEIIKIDRLAKENKLKIILHNWTNDINCVANIHLGCALDTCQMIESNLTYNPLRNKLLKDTIMLKDSKYYLSEKPGLGIELNEKTLDEYSFDLN